MPIRQLFWFSLIGTSAAAVNFLVLTVGTEWLGWWYPISATCGYIISAGGNFIANKLITFDNRAGGRQWFWQFVRFHTTLIGGLLIQISVMYALTENMGLDYRHSWFYATLLVAGWNFTLHRLWTFRSTKSDSIVVLPLDLK